MYKSHNDKNDNMLVSIEEPFILFQENGGYIVSIAIFVGVIFFD